MSKVFLMIGGICAGLAVALGAFGAHGLKEKISSDMLAIYQTGVQYQMYHALGILLVAILYDKFAGSPFITWSGWFMFIGIIIFSGSLYILSMTGLRWFGAITPIGGVAFLVGWILLITSAFKS